MDGVTRSSGWWSSGGDRVSVVGESKSGYSYTVAGAGVGESGAESGRGSSTVGVSAMGGQL